jgi:hypothetical protein
MFSITAVFPLLHIDRYKMVNGGNVRKDGFPVAYDSVPFLQLIYDLPSGYHIVFQNHPVYRNDPYFAVLTSK